LLGSRGAILSIILSYGLFYKNKLNYKYILFAILFVIALTLTNRSIFLFYFSKINPFSENYNALSDLNRLYYIIATIDYCPNIFSFLFGNGVKFNKNIISSYFKNNDVYFTPLDNATVHNLFLEYYSDYGIVAIFLLIIILLRLFKILSQNETREVKPIIISFSIFCINYNLEPNYVHYFFWFILTYYTYVVYQLNRGHLNAERF